MTDDPIKGAPPTASEFIGDSLRIARKRKGWTQEQLAKALRDVGNHLHPTAIAKVEAGKRGATVDELLALAYVLDVAPIHLLVPTSDAFMRVTNRVVVKTTRAREWVRGFHPLPSQDRRMYFSHAPGADFSAFEKGHRSREELEEYLEREGGQVIEIGQATETEVAHPMTPKKSKPV